MPATALTTADRARHWADDAELHEVRFTAGPGNTVRAVILAPHPLADDVSVRVQFDGADRPAALAGARSELLALARRVFADEARHQRAVADAREAYLYQPNVRGMSRARRAMIARGHAEPHHHEIQRAWLALKIDRGHEDHLVAEVVDQVLDERRRLAGPHVASQPIGQAALL